MITDPKRLLGKRIKELRKNKNYTQQELAELANIDQRSLSHIECGDTFPSKCLFDLSNALEVNVRHMFDFEHHKYTIEEMKDYIKTEVETLKDEHIILLYRFINSLK